MSFTESFCHQLAFMQMNLNASPPFGETSAHGSSARYLSKVELLKKRYNCTDP
jgi:hypothetical protein